jgi:hypothetical protein
MRSTSVQKINHKLIVFWAQQKWQISQNFKLSKCALFTRSRSMHLSFLLSLKYYEFRVDFLHISSSHNFPHQDFLSRIFWNLKVWFSNFFKKWATWSSSSIWSFRVLPEYKQMADSEKSEVVSHHMHKRRIKNAPKFWITMALPIRS